MAHIKCIYTTDNSFEGEYHEFEKTVKYYELDGYLNLDLKDRNIKGDDIEYLEIDGRILRNDI